jgi:STE24 endopeptidase
MENAILGLSLFILFPIIGCLIILLYLKRLFKEKPKSLREKINRNKKFGIVYLIYVLICAILLIISFIFYNLLELLAYLLNISEFVSICLIIVWFIIVTFMPMILAILYIIKQYTEIETKKLLMFAGILIGVFTLPLIIGYLTYFYVCDKILEFFGNYLSKIPIPINIAFWLIVASIVFYSAEKLIDIIVLKPKYVENSEIVEMVDELIKKLNTKPFKEIKVEDSPIANAEVSGLFNEKLIISTKLIKILSKEELKSIIAHEIAHKKKQHIKIGLFEWFVIGIIVFSGLSYSLKFFNKLFGNIGFIWIGLFMCAYFLDIVIDRHLSKKREIEVDIIASKITNPKTFIKALSKIHYANYMPEDEILNLISTHPSLMKRIKYIQREFNIPDEEVEKIMNEAYEEIEKLQKRC